MNDDLKFTNAGDYMNTENGHIVFEHCVIKHADPKKIDEVLQNISDGKFIAYDSTFRPTFMDVGDSVIRLDDNTLELNFLSTGFDCPTAEYASASFDGYQIKSMWYDPSYMTAGTYDDSSIDLCEFYNFIECSADEVRAMLPAELDDQFDISSNLEAEEEESLGDGEGNLEHS